MQITTVTWIMTLSLIGTYILLNILENKKIKKSHRRLEKDRRHFSYTYHKFYIAVSRDNNLSNP